MAQPTVPTSWQAVMAPKGLHSARDLAARAGVAPSTITRMFKGEADSSEDTLAAVADALGISVLKARALAGAPAGEAEPFLLPPEASRLNRRQRDAVLEIVRVLLEAQGSSMSAVPVTPVSDRKRGLRVASKRARDPGDGGTG